MTKVRTRTSKNYHFNIQEFCRIAQETSENLYFNAKNKNTKTLHKNSKKPLPSLQVPNKYEDSLKNSLKKISQFYKTHSHPEKMMKDVSHLTIYLSSMKETLSDLSDLLFAVFDELRDSYNKYIPKEIKEKLLDGEWLIEEKNDSYYCYFIYEIYQKITEIIFHIIKNDKNKSAEFIYLHYFINESLEKSNWQVCYDKFQEKYIVKLDTPVDISYRDEGNGKGPFFDHYTIQRSGNCRTRTALGEEQNRSDLESEIRQQVRILPRGEKNKEGKNLPEANHPQNLQKDFATGGLLVIPGRARNTETKRLKAYTDRQENERALLKEALRSGRPILAICAGAWTLWEQELWKQRSCPLKKLTVHKGTTQDVSDHNYRGGMPQLSISDTQPNVVKNKLIHKISLQQGSLLATAMGYKPQETPENIPVNSVHWKAVDPTSTPRYSYTHKQIQYFYQISATCLPDEELAPQSATHKGRMQPDVSPEAYESTHGAPILGIQWHPEAFNASDKAENHPRRHINLIQFMVKAGQTFHQKKIVLEEILQTIPLDESAS